MGFLFAALSGGFGLAAQPGEPQADMRVASTIPENGDGSGPMALPEPLDRRLQALPPALPLPANSVGDALPAVPRVAPGWAFGRRPPLPGPLAAPPPASWPAPPRGWFCRFEDGLARRLPWAIDFGTD